jgi:hypothetical protein
MAGRGSSSQLHLRELEKVDGPLVLSAAGSLLPTRTSREPQPLAAETAFCPDPSRIVRFLGQLNPVRFASTHDNPFLYLPSCPGSNLFKVDKRYVKVAQIIPKKTQDVSIRPFLVRHISSSELWAVEGDWRSEAKISRSELRR